MDRNTSPHFKRQSLLWVVCLCLLTGCETKEEVSTPSISPKVDSDKTTEANGAPDQAPQPWETPEDLLLFVTRHQPSGYEKDFALSQTAVACVDAEDLSYASRTIRLIRTPERQKKTQKRQILKLIYTDRNAQALKLAGKMKSPAERGRAQHRIASKMIKDGAVTQARNIVKQMTDLNSKYKVVQLLSGTLKTEADIEQAIEESRSQLADERELTLCCVAVRRANLDQIPQATALLRELRSAEYQQIAAGTLARSQLKAGQIGSAMSLVRQGAVDPYDSLRYDISRQLKDSSNIEQAIQVAQEMEYLDYQTRAIYYIADKLLELNQPQRAQEVILLVNKAAQNEEEEKERFSTLASFAGQLLKQGNLDQIKEYAAKLDIEVFRYYKFFKKLIENQLKQGDLEQALQLTETFPEADIYAAASFHLANQGQFDQAREIALKIKDGYHRSAALAPLVVQLLKTNELDQAFAVLQKMDDTGFQCTGPESRQYHDSPHHWHSDKYVYEKMIEKLLDADQLERALAVTQLLNEQKEQSVYTGYLCEQLIKREKFQAACDVALNFSAETKYQARVLRTTYIALQKAIERQWARELTQQTSIPELKAELHLKLASKFRELQDPPESQKERLAAKKMIKKLEQTRLNPECARNLVTALIEAGELTQATNIASRIEDRLEKLPALYAVTQELTKGTPLEYSPYPKGTIRDHKLKPTFTPEEKQLARQIVAAIQDD
ncbi:hypothetical protein [Gimesia fumaroli]|uniref:Anaphase-promoting complex, cyclosome, subunit 3 n=1 Tax=Gimesia fumaroli TaxID=2527976 RepID=A0A518I736_9PLAN|nr:hypothetical protein [Gimesia fumaroli]QDV48888.1 hypothetical protein Enr17x_09030 [Gimesia fumaroli]